MSIMIISAFLRMLREDKKADKEKQEEKPMTWKQFFIDVTAFFITVFIGLKFLGAMEYIIALAP